LTRIDDLAPLETEILALYNRINMRNAIPGDKSDAKPILPSVEQQEDEDPQIPDAQKSVR
jgi:hypothetical protein